MKPLICKNQGCLMQAGSCLYKPARHRFLDGAIFIEWAMSQQQFRLEMKNSGQKIIENDIKF